MYGDPELDDEDAAQALALAEEHDRAVPGLEGIDVDKVSQDIAAAGQQPVAPVPGAPPQPLAAGPTTPAAQPELAKPALGPAEEEPAQPTKAEAAEAKTELGGAPPRPKLTGDPQKDIQSNLQWSRQLTDYQTALQRKEGELAQRYAEVEARKAEREAETERVAAERRQAEVNAYQQQRAQRQQAIDSSVAEKAAAYQDVKNGGEKSWGQRIGEAVAIALGAYGQGLMLAGHVQGARNEGLEAVKRNIEADHQRRAERLKAASDAVLEARYGLKDAAENHRAALADIDADRAAKYRLVAAEAAQQLKAQGASDQDVKTNAVVVEALQQAAKSEDAIHAREESTQVAREHNIATEKLATASLDATKAQHRETNAEARERIALTKEEMRLRHEDRADAAAAKHDTAEAKKADDLEKRTLRDPDTGDPIVVLSRPGAVDKAAEKLTAARAYSQGLRELADDIEKNGRVAPGLPLVGDVTDASKRRSELHANAVARGRKALELGVSNANLQLEHAAVGGAGKGLGSIGSPEVLRKIADDSDRIANERLRASGKVVPGALPPSEKTGGAPAGGRAGGEAAAPKTEPSRPARPAVMRLGGLTYHLQPDGTYQ